MKYKPKKKLWQVVISSKCIDALYKSISDTPRRKSEMPLFKPNLSWTHYRSLMRIN